MQHNMTGILKENPQSMMAVEMSKYRVPHEFWSELMNFPQPRSVEGIRRNIMIGMEDQRVHKGVDG